jgi:hypothetical protein
MIEDLEGFGARLDRSAIADRKSLVQGSARQTALILIYSTQN